MPSLKNGVVTGSLESLVRRSDFELGGGRRPGQPSFWTTRTTRRFAWIMNCQLVAVKSDD